MRKINYLTIPLHFIFLSAQLSTIWIEVIDAARLPRLKILFHAKNK
jgi:hypothetical protein